MGKTKTALIGETPSQGIRGQEKYEKKAKQKRSAKEERGVRVPGLGGGQRVVAVTADLPEEKPSSAGEEKKRVHVPRRRSKRYLASLTKIDTSKNYTAREAVELAQKTSTSKFTGKLELHLTLDKDSSAGGRFDVQLPHDSGLAKRRVEIANEDTVRKLEKGTIDFDVLIATPQTLPSLVPFARLLGPQGLMPNPKNGTLVPDPQKALEKFSGNTIILQTEKDVPVIHTVVGKLNDDPGNLSENVAAIIKAIDPQHIKRAVLAPTMGPGIKMTVV